VIKRLLNAIAERRRKSQEIVEDVEHSHELEHCYFIGGSLAGQRRWVRDNADWSCGKDTNSGDRYYRQYWYGSGRRRVIYLHDQLINESVIDVLLDAYCNKEATGDE
jgi:hypothetical protein